MDNKPYKLNRQKCYVTMPGRLASEFDSLITYWVPLGVTNLLGFFVLTVKFFLNNFGRVPNHVWP